MIRRSTLIEPADHAQQLEAVRRRLFLRGGLSLGALGLLTGCDLQDGDAVSATADQNLKNGQKVLPTF